MTLLEPGLLTPEDVLTVVRKKSPVIIHVLGVPSSEGDVMSPHLFGKGQTVTGEVYLRVLQTAVKPWNATVVSAGL